MDYIISVQIFKIILYRDIYVNEDIINNDYHYTLGKNKDVFLKSFGATNSP